MANDVVQVIDQDSYVGRFPVYLQAQCNKPGYIEVKFNFVNISMEKFTKSRVHLFSSLPVQTDSVVKCFFTGKNPFFSGKKEAVFTGGFFTSEFLAW